MVVVGRRDNYIPFTLYPTLCQQKDTSWAGILIALGTGGGGGGGLETCLTCGGGTVVDRRAD